MLEQRIQQQFFESADLHYQAADALGRPIHDAVQALVAGVTSGGRLWVAGVGPWSGLAQWMADALVGRFERDRPGLAAVPLSMRAQGEGGLPAWWSRQLDTLGQPGDLLLLLDDVGDDPALSAAATSAHAKDMTVIALTGRQGGALARALGETDVQVAVPHDRWTRVLETHLLVLHCLCDAIDLQLLGEQDPSA